MADSDKSDLLDEELIKQVASEYIFKEKAWPAKDFRIDIKKVSADGTYVSVWAVYLEDEIHPIPGAGKSLELHIDLENYQVIRQLVFQ